MQYMMYQYSKYVILVTHSNWHSLVLLEYALVASRSIHTSASLWPTIFVVTLVELALINI